MSFFLHLVNRDAVHEKLLLARTALKEFDDPDRAISLLQDALAMSPANSEIHAELSCAYFSQFIVFTTGFIQKNRDSYESSPLKQKSYLQLSTSEQKLLTDQLNFISDSLSMTLSTASSPKHTVNYLWIHSWITRLLKDHYISQLLPPKIPLVLQEDELALIDKAIDIAPKKWELFASKGDFNLKARPDSMSGYRLDSGNYDPVRFYNQASRISGIRSDYFYHILSVIYRKNKNMELLSSLTDAALSRDRNAYYLYSKAEMAIQTPQKFRELIQQAEACERFVQPIYSPSIYPSLRCVWSRVKEEFQAYQKPAFYEPVRQILRTNALETGTSESLCTLNHRLILSITSDKRIQKYDLQSVYFLIELYSVIQSLGQELAMAKRHSESMLVSQLQSKNQDIIRAFFRRISLPENHKAFQRIKGFPS